MSKGLCHRCEHRAAAFEKGDGPRYECWNNLKSAKASCYSYLPTKPLTIQRDEDEKADPRPLGGGYFGCRGHASEGIDMVVQAHSGKQGLTLYWIPKANNKKASKKQ